MEEEREIIREIIDFQNYLKNQYGFDWDNAYGVLEKLEEEIKELREAINKNDNKNIEEEFGDIIITIVNLSRFLDLDIIDSLKKSFEKFKDRFEKMKKLAEEKNLNLKELKINQLDLLWEESK
ncbi:MAG: MazG nucleotide pyrophosphohydrolase domain-containing protein [Caldisericia bacterium]|nr:MazG nucleotide pyrophosphohydrolase domain-containing protein [Caldisericia bacterium]